jgi:hypothetical protein
MPTNSTTKDRVRTYRRVLAGGTCVILILGLGTPGRGTLEPVVEGTAHVWTKAEVKYWTKLLWHTTEQEWKCLDQLNRKESQWNWLIRNSHGGAYGIAQAKPASKYAVISKDWKTNPMTQVIWQKKYIESRYQGHPCYAWKHEKKRKWY